MTATIAGDMGETPQGSEHYHALFTVGLLLLAFTFILNLISEYFLARCVSRNDAPPPFVSENLLSITMRLFIRQSSNQLFTALAGASVLLLLLALILVLTPMLYRGSGLCSLPAPSSSARCSMTGINAAMPRHCRPRSNASIGPVSRFTIF